MTPTKTLFRCVFFFLFLRVSVGNYERSKTSSKKKRFRTAFSDYEAFVTSGDFCVTTIQGSSDGHLNSYVRELNVNRNMPDFTNHATARI